MWLQGMTETTRLHHYKVASRYGAQVWLQAKNDTEALSMGAKLLDEPLENLSAINSTADF